ncbi:IS66 family insertion sequence element accessory protein TnpB [Bradyrhizobium sp. ma5]|uniref:IS66 family insertion sequence element accessory protein TnpB n=1 Tax=Bradyrhizobium sp. ma5 TaxID=3344828 RepID=UPI0035D51FCF
MDEFKAQVVAEALEPGASVPAFTRRGCLPGAVMPGPSCIVPRGFQVARVKVFLASHRVDFSKVIDGLVALVRDAGSDPFDGALYVFRAKRADRIKIVWWDGSGVCLYLKRLEKAEFCWPRIGHHRVQLNPAQLMALVDGMDWKRVRAMAVKPPEIVNQRAERAREPGQNVLWSAQ